MKTLNAKLKHGSLPRDVHKRRDAVLALSEARKVFDADQAIEAREAAIEANRLSPDLIPAAVMAAHSYIETRSKEIRDARHQESVGCFTSSRSCCCLCCGGA